MKRAGLMITAGAITVALVWSHSRQGAQAAGDKGAASPAVAVDAATVGRHDVPGYLEGLGTAQAFYTVKVTARVDGQLDTVAFTEGQTLKEGQVVAQRAQARQQSSMMTSSELRRRMEPTGQPIMQSGARHWRQEGAMR